MKEEVRRFLIHFLPPSSFFRLPPFSFHLFLAFSFLLSHSSFAIDASDRYRSPRNPERAIRRTTELIILHTTEAPARSSLNKVSDRGECHFCVTEDGSVYRIVDRDREAFHAGRSMWNGKEDVDKFSIGIECVGHHDKAMPLVQLDAIARLVRELKSMYHLTDSCVLTHSQVAYGAPNRWQKKRHRGRKRCGMLFATATVRRILGLGKGVQTDADVKARRLVVADPYLNRVLYGGLDIMAASYPKPPPRKTAGPAAQKTAKPSPRKTVRPATGQPSPPRSTTELVTQGFQICGTISAKLTPAQIAGKRWNSSSTYYSIHGKVTPGDKIDPTRLEKGTNVWLKP